MTVHGLTWEQQEAGWWVSDLGGLCEEGNRWRFWPAIGTDDSRAWTTLHESMDEVGLTCTRWTQEEIGAAKVEAKRTAVVIGWRKL